MPLIFIPYLLLARSFRPAAVAGAAFAATVLAGWVVAPADSARWRPAACSSRAAGPGSSAGTTSRCAACSPRLAGQRGPRGARCGWPWRWSPAAQPGWPVRALLTWGRSSRARDAGLRADRAAGVPISWDHHWVWIVPGVAVAAASPSGHARPRGPRPLAPQAGPRLARGASRLPRRRLRAIRRPRRLVAGALARRGVLGPGRRKARPVRRVARGVTVEPAGGPEPVLPGACSGSRPHRPGGVLPRRGPALVRPNITGTASNCSPGTHPCSADWYCSAS